MSTNRIPVILDTDIGNDIDDTWALAYLLKCPQLDLKLVTVSTGDTPYRAKIVAKFLDVAGASHIPIAMGRCNNAKDTWGPQAPWVYEYDLESYPGEIYEDGATKMVETIIESDEPVIVIGIGPLETVAEALRKEPRITNNARFIGMHGSIYRGYGGRVGSSPEYNVAQDPDSCRMVFEAPWEVTITPLDTCGLVTIDGARFSQLRDSGDAAVQAVLENYEIWSYGTGFSRTHDPGLESSVLYDTVAIYLALSEDLVVMESLPVKVTKIGMTKPGGKKSKSKKIRCAVGWKSLELFKELLVNTLIS
ncbi:MAG: nucleoside hydrolase [Promethearchaeota archaeon]